MGLWPCCPNLSLDPAGLIKKRKVKCRWESGSIAATLLEKIYNEVTKWLLEHLSPLYLSMLVFVCSVFLFFPPFYLKYFALDTWAIRFRPYFAVGFLASSFLLLGHAGKYFNDTFIFRWRHKRNLLKYLETELSADEVMLLSRYAESGKKTQYLDPTNGVANNLVRALVLYVPSAEYIRTQGAPYTLTRAAAPLVLDRDRFQKIILAENKVNKRAGNSN